MKNCDFIIRIHDSEKKFATRSGTSVLSALMPTHGDDITAGCYSGGCGVCKIQVLSGRYATGVMSKVHVTDAEKKDGYCLACKTMPESDLIIRPLRKVPPKIGHRFGYLAR
ncbi:2Fe-2S iron-sulfur cluster binding domain-containing protein [Zhongshania sp. BJYM1]|uniref:2Fe-2S iron-sulfur cluster binding domain-containing protein n=1 Tax=Zhongshania aquatica TaxID=2965069 RepID=UPI0033130323